MAVLCSKLRYWAAQITALLFAALALFFAIRSLVEERDGAATYGATGWIQTVALVSIPIVIWWTRGKRVAPYIQAMQIVFILSVILWLASLPTALLMPAVRRNRRLLPARFGYSAFDLSF